MKRKQSRSRLHKQILLLIVLLTPVVLNELRICHHGIKVGLPFMENAVINYVLNALFVMDR